MPSILSAVIFLVMCNSHNIVELYPPNIRPFPARRINDISTVPNIVDIHSFKGRKNIIAINTNLGSGIYGNTGINYVDGMNALAYYNAKTGTVTTVSPPPNSSALAENDQACIDQKNNIYYYFTEVYNQTEQILHSYFGAFNLSNPSHPMDIIELPLCYADFLVGAGTAFAANSMTGDIFMWCHDATNYLEQTDLFKLTWNDVDKIINSTFIKSYNVGDILTFSTFPTILDTKRNTLWVIESYGHNLTNFTVEFNAVNVLNGDINRQINIENWTLITGQYSEMLDTIVSVVPFVIEESVTDKYLGINVTYNDPVTTEMTKFIGTVNISSYYCDLAPVYTLDDKNSIWYQLMYRDPEYGSCLLNNGTLSGDLLSINVKTAQVIDEVYICEYGPNALTCPLSMEYWY